VGFGPQLVDLNGDGLKDMLSGSWPGELYLFQRKPNRMFDKSVQIATAKGEKIKVGSATALAVTDWNGDGLLDLLIGDIEGQMHFARNQGATNKPVFAPPTRMDAGGSLLKVGGDSGPCVADWDGDGVNDLLVGEGNGQVTFFKNTGTAREPKLAAGTTLVNGSGYSAGGKTDGVASRAKPAVADWNGDGQLDLLVGDFRSSGGDPQKPEYHGYVWVYLRKPSGKPESASVN